MLVNPLNLREVKTKFGFTMLGIDGDNVTNEIESGNMDRLLIDYLVENAREDDVFLDIGANIGYFTLAMAQKCKKVMAVEPDPINFAILVQNIELMKSTRSYPNQGCEVQVFCLAVMDNWFYEFVRTKGNCGATAKGMAYGQEDSFFAYGVSEKSICDYSRPTIVKTDTQGCDFEIHGEMTKNCKRNIRMYALEFWPEGDRYGKDYCIGAKERMKNECDKFTDFKDNLVMEWKR